MKVDFQMDCITNKNQEHMVAITHLNMQEEGKTVDCFLEDLENNTLLHETITPENTGVILGAVELEKAYHIRIEDAENIYVGEITAHKNAEKETVFLETNIYISPAKRQAQAARIALEKAEIESQRAATNVKYQAYAGSSKEGSAQKSLFAAIELIRTKANGVVKRTDTGATVFDKNSDYHKYQFTAYYGSCSTQEQAKKWIEDFAYSHVIKKDCHLYDNSFISQTMSGVKVEAWNKESDNGGYVVKYANMWLGYRTGSATVNLSQARLKASTNSKQGCNAFVYISTQNNDVTVDFGLICSPHSNGNWYPCYNIAGLVDEHGNKVPGFKKFDDVIVTSTKNSSGEYLPNKDVTMQYTFDEKGNIFFTVNGKPYTIESSKTGIKKFDRSFLFMTSYVPILGESNQDKQTPDFRNDGYFRNVVWKNCKLGKTTPNVPFNYNSSNRSLYLEYNTDCCSTNHSGTTETVNIFYDREYTE